MTDLQSKLDSFTWYHEIQVGDAITKPKERFQEAWDLIEQGISDVMLRKQSVLDVGCRDGKWSLIAEQRGAEVHAFDNDESFGFRWLRHHLNSSINFRQLNLYGLTKEEKRDIVFPEQYDIVFFFGVLYHLRFPMLGLHRVCDALKENGKLLIETAIYDKHEDAPLLYCPVRSSPYEITSCTFFNLNGLTETLWSMGVTVRSHFFHPSEEGKEVRRCFIECEKTHEVDPMLVNYWHGLHKAHSQ